MDLTEQHQKLQPLREFTVSQFLKKLTQLLLSVSVFSFLFSHSTWLSFLFHSFNFYSFPLQLLTHSINKNCIFLLCNGILVVLAKRSGLIRSSSSYAHAFEHTDEYLFKKSGLGLPLLLDKEATGPLESTAADDREERDDKAFFEEEETGNSIEEDEDQEVLDNRTSGFEEQTLKETSLQTSLFIEDEKGEEEKEENCSLSDEEWNKKFDDFIRKMKEEIRIGSISSGHNIVINESSSFHESV